MANSSSVIYYLIVSTFCLVKIVQPRPLPSQQTDTSDGVVNSNTPTSNQAKNSSANDIVVKVIASMLGAIAAAIIAYIISVWKKFYVPIEFTDKYRSAYHSKYDITSNCCVYGLFSQSGYFLSRFICCCCCKSIMPEFKEMQYDESTDWDDFMKTIKVESAANIRSMMSLYANYNLHFQNFCKFENCENHSVSCFGCSTPPVTFFIALDWHCINKKLELNYILEENTIQYQKIYKVPLLAIAEAARPLEKEFESTIIKALKENTQGIYVVLLNFPNNMEGLNQNEKDALKVILDFIKTYHVKHCYSSQMPVKENQHLPGKHDHNEVNEKTSLLHNQHTDTGTRSSLDQKMETNHVPDEEKTRIDQSSRKDKYKTKAGQIQEETISISNPPIAVESGNIKVDSGKYNLEAKMILYKLSKNFAGKREDGKKFCEVFTDYDPNVDRVFGNADKFDYPVLEVTATWVSNNRPTDLLKVVNEALKNSGHGGSKLRVEDIKKNPFANFDTSVKKDFNERKTRIPTFNTISTECVGDERYIAHFLLPYSEIVTIVHNKPDNIRGRLREVLETWHRSCEWNTWPYLRSLLLFLDKGLVVDIIEKS